MDLHAADTRTDLADENARLRAELRDARARQAATDSILQTISRSPAELRPVFENILLAATRLVRAQIGFVLLCDDETRTYSPVAAANVEGPLVDLGPAGLPIDPDHNFPSRAILSKQRLHLPDWSRIDLPEHERRIRELFGVNAALYLPLMRGDTCIGLFAFVGGRAGDFDANDIALVESFRDQALIAIENARLFNETRDALERQTATAEILKVIAGSPSEVQPVFEAIARRANALIGGYSSTVFRFIDGMAHLVAFTPTTPAADAFLRSTFPRPLSEFSPFRMAMAGEVTQIPDTERLDDDIRPIAKARGFRSMLFAPLMHQKSSIGFIAVTRVQPGGFDHHHVDLLRTFADQAVIAIENARLFSELEARTRDLTRSLDELRTAQDRLVHTEKLASLGQLTAGIAHEIKNPLNFVNNFASLSADLVDELDEALAGAGIAAGGREEIDEIAGLLKDNLRKVVQHGRRADSIVKNMLLHSREGSGEHRAVDINALVEESVNLAYHGARAETPDFNATLERDLDPSAGAVDIFPQEITRVLLNLISNGFYAISQRRQAETGAGYEPTLRTTTRTLGDLIEIRVRDNGTGIPTEVKAKMFNPFFTTKPPGEGTGLGLSMSHDIVVKQHGGSIDVETEPGEFTEFIIRLPRVRL